MAQILIAQDQRAWQEMLSKALGYEHEVEFWEGLSPEVDLEKRMFDVAIVDFEEGGAGKNVLGVLRSRSPET